MAILDNILALEATNQSAIYLYEHQDSWFAYEQSAYHFSRIFRMGKIARTEHLICIAISPDFEFLHSPAMHSMQITSVADSELKIESTMAFKGFEQWKQEQLSLAPPVHSSNNIKPSR